MRICPETIRDMTWAQVRTACAGDRLTIWRAMLELSRGSTTREIAAHTGLPLLTVRPRVTELCDMGLVYCCGRARNGKISEGLYQAQTEAAAERNWTSGHQAEREASAYFQPALI